MAPTLNQEDIKLLKGIFATKEDIKSIKEDLVSMESRFDKKFATKEDLQKIVLASEKKITERIDFMINVLDKEHVKLAKDVDKIKIHVGLPILN
jgi:hypothetical protein